MKALRYGAAIAFVATILTVGSGTAAAEVTPETTTPSALRTAPDPGMDAATLRTLTAGQRAALDREVDRVLTTTTGGTRIGANQISWDNGDVVMTVAVPGQVTTQGQACSYLRVCLYDAGEFRGSKISFYHCATHALSKYGWTNRTTSWVNNQSQYTYSRLMYWYQAELQTADASRAFSADTLYDWYNNKVDWIKVC